MNWTILSFSGGMSSLFSYLFAPLLQLANLARPAIMYAISARDTSAAPVAPNISDNAPSDFARIVSVAIVKTSVDISAWDANTDTEWDALETASDMIILGPVRGMMPEGSIQTANGYGFLDMRKKYHTYDIPFSHAGSAEDILTFWDTVADQSGDWSCMFVFEDLKGLIFESNLSLLPMTFNARLASESEEIGDERKMMVNCQFKAKRQPRVIDLSAASANFKLN